MRVLILGVDGYLGWTLSLYLSARGYEVFGCDNGLRRTCVEQMGSQSVTPIGTMKTRFVQVNEKKHFFRGSVLDYPFLQQVFAEVEPDAIVHFAEIPSAPYSMRDREACVEVQMNNVVGTLNVLYAMQTYTPWAHLLKLGTMGEYGTPGILISEGPIMIEYGGRRALANFPRRAGSWYHLSKVHDTANIEFACNVWGLRCTDVMQGVVYGVHIAAMGQSPELLTRFDVDEAFGTAINRFCAQALVGMPITPYGKGRQKRGFLPLQDSMLCFELALRNPPAPGEHRVVNQLEQVFALNDLAAIVAREASLLGLSCRVGNIPNPRKESEDHFYKVECKHLASWGYMPQTTIEQEVQQTLSLLRPYTERISRDAITPRIVWRT